jgi:hypothetical protein
VVQCNIFPQNSALNLDVTYGLVLAPILVLRCLLLSNASLVSVHLVVQYLSCSGESFSPNTFSPPVRLVVQCICRSASCGPEKEVLFLLISYKYNFLLCDTSFPSLQQYHGHPLHLFYRFTVEIQGPDLS